MASPTFDSQIIFDSTDGTDTFSEGLLIAGPYSGIRQKIHFNGENGDRYLTHGWGDRTWTYKGLMSHTSIDALFARFALIEGYIDASITDPSTYHPLTDSLGQSFDAAQIHNFAYDDNIHVGINRLGLSEYVASVVVTGIIQGMEVDGAGDSDGGDGGDGGDE